MSCQAMSSIIFDTPPGKKLEIPHVDAPNVGLDAPVPVRNGIQADVKSPCNLLSRHARRKQRRCLFALVPALATSFCACRASCRIDAMGSTVPAEAFAGLEWHYVPALAASEAPVAVWAAPHSDLQIPSAFAARYQPRAYSHSAKSTYKFAIQSFTFTVIDPLVKSPVPRLSSHSCPTPPRAPRL